jgi:hypothetical protein
MGFGLRVALLEHDPHGRSATGVRGRAIKSALEATGHSVSVLSPPPGAAARFARQRFSIAARLGRRLRGRPTLPHYWDHLADYFEPILRRGGFDVAIGRGQDVSQVFCRGVGCPTILDMANVLFLESYYQWGATPVEVIEAFEKESALLGSVDYILSPHELLTGLLLDHFADRKDLAGKVLTVPLGSVPARRVARFGEPPRIVYAGSYHYIQDPYLLALLTRHSPYAIECYGPHDPNLPFLPARLDYRGYAPDESFLADYQFGLITVSRDRLREYSPATKLPYYLAHGLPVLFPEWMREGHLYPDCAIPYREETFAQVVRAAAARWSSLHEAALLRSKDMTWDVALAPLVGLLEQIAARLAV